MSPYLDDGDAVLYAGDCREVMRELNEGSVAAVVTDPPYGIRFMGQAWDAPTISAAAARDAATRQTLGPHAPTRPGRAEPRSASAFGNGAGQAGSYDETPAGLAAFGAWCEEWGRECRRVLAPGGHLLAFGGTRTFGWLMVALSAAGFEIRDTITWHYGSGFPKSLDVSKAIDREAGAEREVVGKTARCVGQSQDEGYLGTPTFRGGGNDLTAPATPEAARWQGWGTALKPATELIVVARKPLAERTVARQVLATGTGALNVDGCRVAGVVPQVTQGAQDRVYGNGRGLRDEPMESSPHPGGRWPPNLVLDDAAAAEMDAQSGVLHARGNVTPTRRDQSNGVTGWGVGPAGPVDPGDTGGASRFFPRFRYEAKADGAERDGATHPTVKPLALMRWLVRLVTPPGGMVLDPFAGSGTTLLAARQEGFRSIGIEREQEYLAMAAHRLRQLSLLA